MSFQLALRGKRQHGRHVRPRNDRGASAVEYGLMVAAIAAIIVGVVFGLGTVVSATFEKTCRELSTELNPGCGTKAPAEQPGDGEQPPADPADQPPIE